MSHDIWTDTTPTSTKADKAALLLQRRAGEYVIDHLPPFEAMEVIEMLLAPLREMCGRCGKGTTGEHDYDCLDGVR